jgi:hypothetical protein
MFVQNEPIMSGTFSFDKDMSAFTKHLNNFIITLTYSIAESVHETQGEVGLKTMSVTIGSRLWDRFEEFDEHSMLNIGTEDEKLASFLDTIKESGLIGDYSCKVVDRMIEVMINDCYFLQASEKQMADGICPPLCPIGGLIVAGLHKTTHLLTTLEEIDHDPETAISNLTFRKHP